MTAAVFHAETAPLRRGWRALLWVAPLTALWIALTYSVRSCRRAACNRWRASLSHDVVARPVAWPRADRFDAHPAAQLLAGGSDPLHIMARGRLARGD